MPRPLRLLSFLLMPFAWLYGGIMRLRNVLYDYHFFHSYQAPIPVICVGNLTVGGTGKTPQVEYIAQVLQGKKIAILSRGYKRKTKGFVFADAQSTAATIGDEPFQYVLNLPQVRVAVCEKRAAGIQNLLRLYPDLEVILLDDAFQHRAVKATKNLLLTDYNRLFTKDYVLPVGRLREPRSGANRADAVVVTKCPASLTPSHRNDIRARILKYTHPETPIFFSEISYGTAVPMGAKAALSKSIILVTGIAQAEPLVEHLKKSGFSILHHFNEADHASYSPEKIAEVLNLWNAQEQEGASILMTQKDAVKWQADELKALWHQAPVFYLPITVSFGLQKTAFDKLIQNWAGEAGCQINL